MPKREFLMKAHTLDLAKPKMLERFNGVDQYWSVKLDGMRAFWDGFSSGMKMPWTSEISTGLWTTNGNVIHATEEWRSQLPEIPLDGELWLGPQRQHEVVSIARRRIPDPRWSSMKYMIYDSPPLSQVFRFGVIDTPHANIDLNYSNMAPIKAAALESGVQWDKIMRFEDFYTELRGESWGPAKVLEQNRITSVAGLREVTDIILPRLLDNGHEGIVFRRARSLWVPERSHDLLKFKPFIDDEARVIGVTAGEKGFEGMIGALSVDWRGKTFDIGTGLNYDDRAQPSEYWIGRTITFKYRELTAYGIPKEARYFRGYVVE